MDTPQDFFPYETGGAGEKKNTGIGKKLASLCKRFRLDCDEEWNERQIKMYVYRLFYEGKIYDNLSPWHAEYYGGIHFVPIVNRRPCVIYAMPEIIVNESVGILFGDDHFPTIRCEDEKTEVFLHNLSRISNLNYAMVTAAKKGALGSVCIIVKVLDSKFYFDVLETINLHPVFDRLNPTRLKKLTEKVKVKGYQLAESGYDIKDAAKNQETIYWLVREWTENEEIYYLPVKNEKDWQKKLVVDDECSSRHGFGFLPAVWIKNMPVTTSEIDGPCTFGSILDNCIEIDYQLSQLARLLRYNSDPMLVVKDPSNLEGEELIKGQGRLTVGDKGEAYLLQLDNASTQSVLEFVKTLRQFALEAVRGNRTNPDKMNAINSGKAIQMLNQSLIGLASELRISYGELGLLEIYKIVLKICESDTTEISDVYGEYGDVDKSLSGITFDWPDWYPPTPNDTLQENQALQIAIQGKFLSEKAAALMVAEKYHILDTKNELTEIQSDVTRAILQNAGGSSTSKDVDIDKRDIS